MHRSLVLFLMFRAVLPIFLVLGAWLAGVTAGQATPAANAAVQDSLQAGKALCKVISPTDAGASQSHQAGLYLPKAAWRFFTNTAPVEGENRRQSVELAWPDGRTTEAVVNWYGKGSRSEFRLTRLAEALDQASVGDLLVLVPQDHEKFRAHLLRTEEDEAEFCTALGIEAGQRWGFYEKSPIPTASARGVEAWAEQEASKHDAFPSGRTMAELARQAVRECQPAILAKSADHRLMAWIEAEYAIYRAIERRVCASQVQQDFTNVEDFLAAAATLMNRRKARAGHSLEAHVEFLLTECGITFEAQAVIDGKVRPDVLFPSKTAYDDPTHPVDQLLVLGLKTTCRDRWRQVLNEGKRLPVKHLLTLQPAMSRAQLTEMQEAKLQLIVPAGLHRAYDVPPSYHLQSVEEFVRELQRRFPK